MKQNHKIETRGRPKENKIQAINLIANGMDLKEVSKKTGLSLNRIYEIRKENIELPQYKPIKKQKPTKEQPQLKIKEQPIINHYQTKSFIIKQDETKKYIPRKIGTTTDLNLINYFYSIRKPLLIEGDSGTGKTHSIRHFCIEKKLPYQRVNLNGNSRPEELIGQFIPDEAKAGFKWQDGLLTTFVKNGGVFVIDEMNAGNPEMLFFLHSLTDDERQIVLTQKDGEVIKAHPDFWLVATMNPDYEGTKPLNEALKRRFQVLRFDYSEEAEKKYVKNSKILEFAKKIREMFREGELTTPLSTDQLIELETLIDKFGYNTATTIFLNRFKIEEEKSIKEVMNLILNPKKEKENDEKKEDAVESV